MGEILSNCKGIVGLIDDVLVYRRTAEEHDERLMAVLDKLKEKGVTLNKEKCIFYCNSIQFLGQIVNQGVSPNKEKLCAIREVSRPNNVSELRRFLGMISHMSKFSPNLADRSQLLRTLLSRKNHWIWGPDRQSAFEGPNKALCSRVISNV